SQGESETGFDPLRSTLRLAMPDVAFAETEPARSGHFLLSKKLDAFFALHVEVAEKGFVPAVEREPRHRGRHADVDSDHAALNAMLELARGFAGACENRSAVAVRRAVGGFDSGIQILEAHHVEHGPEDFFFGDGHAALHLI